MMIIIEAARSHSLFLGSPIVELPTQGDRARERLILEQVILSNSEKLIRPELWTETLIPFQSPPLQSRIQISNISIIGLYVN